MTKLVWYLIYAAGAAVILGFWWHATGSQTALTAPALNIAAGNVTGLMGTYALLWELVLLSRLPILEAPFGLEWLALLHKWNGYLALILLGAHGIFLVAGYALAERVGYIHQFVVFNLNWEDVLKATVGFALLLGIVGISISIVRRGLKYETWYYVHLFTYLAILLSFSHQLSVGSDFLRHPAFQYYWYGLYVVSFGLIGWYRFLVPAWLVYWHRFVVEKVVPEAPGIVSIYITGRHLGRFRYVPGQFAIWRFLSRELWWQAHPFSFSQAPDGRHIRLTVKMLGDYTRQLEHLRPGTLVSPDGPHGNFTLAQARKSHLLLIAGGIGITPIRSMLGDLPAGAQATVIYAARNPDAVAFRAELGALAARTGAQLHYHYGPLSQARLRTLAPEAAQCEVWLCGPPAMMTAVTSHLQALGLNKKSIHTEQFAY